MAPRQVENPGAAKELLQAVLVNVRRRVARSLPITLPSAGRTRPTRGQSLAGSQGQARPEQLKAIMWLELAHVASR